jgi:hypothetical protein
LAGAPSALSWAVGVLEVWGEGGGGRALRA